MEQHLAKNGNPPAIVVGLDSHQGIQTARILASHQIPIIALAQSPDHYCCRTRVCEQILYTDFTSQDLIKTLKSLGPTLSQKGVLIPCSDVTVQLISQHRDVLQPWYYILLPDETIVERLIDKIQFYTYAQEQNLPIPQTMILYNREDAKRAAQTMTFPCALKPPISADPRWEQNSKHKTYKVAKPEDLLELYDVCSKWADVLIVQKWVEGDDTALYICNTYFSRSSEPLVTFISRKLRQWPPRTGECCLGIEADNKVILDETLRLFKMVGYYGLGYMEMKRDKLDGNYYIMEPNVGRPTGQGPIAEAGGVSLLYTMYCDTVGLPLPANRAQQYGQIKWIYLRRDLQSAVYYLLRGELNPLTWLRSLFGVRGFALFSWRDPLPFLGDITRAIRLFLIPEERKKRDYTSSAV